MLGAEKNLWQQTRLLTTSEKQICMMSAVWIHHAHIPTASLTFPENKRTWEAEIGSVLQSQRYTVRQGRALDPWSLIPLHITRKKCVCSISLSQNVSFASYFSHTPALACSQENVNVSGKNLQPLLNNMCNPFPPAPIVFFHPATPPHTWTLIFVICRHPPLLFLSSIQ